MSATPKPVPSDEQCVDMLKELVDASLQADGIHYTERGTMLESLWSNWSEIDRDDPRWEAIDALLCMDHDDLGRDVLPEFVAMHTALVGLLAALFNMAVDVVDEGETTTKRLRAVKLAIEALPALQERLEDAIAEVEA